MQGINPEYLNQLSEVQREWALTATGNKFLTEFVWQKGCHLFIVGNTGSGKTQKGYWVMDWLCRGKQRPETQVWISTGKSNEILPLFCMGLPVRIILPKGSEMEVYEGKDKKPIDNLEIVQVSDPGSAWWAVKRGVINIFEFRNTIAPGQRSKWMSELFQTLATWCREGRMPKILPCTIYADETQWFLAGSRITNDTDRAKTAEVVTENATEIRSAGVRLVFFAQDYKNITPASRENMTCTILCRGAQVSREDNAALSTHCYMKYGKIPARYKPNEGKFVHADGTAYPVTEPWQFRMFPEKQEDRDWCTQVRIKYGKKYGDAREGQEEIEDECMPELGRYAALAIPKEQYQPGPSLSELPEVTTDE
jgi:hypothetical protein